jgi:hypothetical protein
MNTTYSPAERQYRTSLIARSIWESEGRPQGQALRHWLMAEKLVQAQEQAQQQADAGAAGRGQPEDDRERG